MVDPVAIQLGPVSIRWYAIFIVSGLFLVVHLAIKETSRRKIIPDDILGSILIAFPLAIIGARVYYVILDWSYYANQPLSGIVATWNGGLTIYGGLVTGTVILFIFSYHRAINPLDFLGIAAPGVMITQAIGRWGSFISQETYGKIVDNLNYLPDFIKNQMYTDGSYRASTFLYGLSRNLLGFVIVMSPRHRPHFFKQDEIAFFYLIQHGHGRSVIEGMRTDSLILLGIRVSQWLSALLVLIGMVLVVWRRKQKGVPYYQE